MTRPALSELHSIRRSMQKRLAFYMIPLAILLPKLGMGTDGLFYAEPIADLIAIATTVILFARNFNKMLYQHADTKVKK